MITIHPQHCPHCGEPPCTPVVNESGRIVELHYLCPNGHVWILKTLNPEAA